LLIYIYGILSGKRTQLELESGFMSINNFSARVSLLLH